MNGRIPEAQRLGFDSEAVAGFLPLVDVLLAVLSVVMILASAAPHTTIPMRLPEVPGHGAAAQDAEVRIMVHRTGKVSVDGIEVVSNRLLEHLRRVPNGSRVVIAGDADADYGTVARLLQIVRIAGHTDARLLAVGDR
jgi:biopolymer transport protein ExbD